MSFLSRILGGGSGGGSDYELLLAQSIEELKLKTAAHDGTWQLGESDWDVDQEAGVIVFSAPSGMRATCSVQIIGTFNTNDNTWLWGWEHPSVLPALQEHAKRVRAYGETHGLKQLVTRKSECEESDAWEYTAFACKLCEAQGAYRGPADGARVFMTFDDVQLGK